MEEGRDCLAAVTRDDNRMIAYPHGDVDDRVVAAARAAGVILGFTTQPEPVVASTDALNIGRVGPSYDSLGRFALRVARALIGGCEHRR
jgi:hypothetical protein